VKPAAEDTSHLEGQLQPKSFLSSLLSSLFCHLFKMSVFDAAPPNTHAGGNDDALRTKGSDPMNAPPVYEVADEGMNMEEYERTVPLWKRVWQHSLTQMMLLSVQAFCGPAMADAIAGEFLQTSNQSGSGIDS
jgi:hypothetical protein